MPTTKPMQDEAITQRCVGKFEQLSAHGAAGRWPLIGAEALISWQHDGLGEPSAVIVRAEGTGA